MAGPTWERLTGTQPSAWAAHQPLPCTASPSSLHQPVLSDLPPCALSELRAIWLWVRTCKVFFTSSSHAAL